jgi:hypothetical protein
MSKQLLIDLTFFMLNIAIVVLWVSWLFLERS